MTYLKQYLNIFFNQRVQLNKLNHKKYEF